MTTDVQDNESVLQDSGREPDLQTELERLLEFKRKTVRGDDMTPCPACDVLVQIRANQCPHCDSNIAANSALIRESLRRLAEITAELDRQHNRLAENHPEKAKRPVRDRIKHLFSAPRKPQEPVAHPWVTRRPRTLDNVWEGEHLKVLECHGPWCLVKTRDGRTGWVYSTIVRDD